MGYSQGGLTALGYLSALKRDHENNPTVDDPLNKIDAVITISGAIRGAQILENDLKNKIKQKITILVRGIGADIGIFTIGPIQLGFLFNIGITELIASNADDIFWLLVNPDDNNILSIFKQVWDDPSLKKMEQLRDMKPGSDYIRENVVKTVIHKYSVKTGKKVLSSEWRSKKVFGKKIWYLWIGLVDEIKQKKETEVIPVFDSDVPVGFIAGIENRTLRMSTNDEYKNSNKNNTAYALSNYLGVRFVTIETNHIIKCLTPWGLISGSPVFAANANRAAKFCFKIDDEVADLTGASKGDGFISLANQHIPSKFEDSQTEEERVHLNNVLSDPYGKGYVDINENHYTIHFEKDGYSANPKTYHQAAQMAFAGFGIRQKNGLRK